MDLDVDATNKALHNVVSEREPVGHASAHQYVLLLTTVIQRHVNTLDATVVPEVKRFICVKYLSSIGL